MSDLFYILIIKTIIFCCILNIIWKYRFAIKQKIVNLGEKHIFLKFLISLYFNNSLLVVTVTLILTTYLLLSVFLYTNIIYESYNILSDFSIKKYQEDVNFINDEFFNKELEDFNLFIERSEKRLDFRDKRLNTESFSELLYKYIKNLEIVRFFWIQWNEWYFKISFIYWELLMKGYFKYWKVFWEWLDKSWPRRTKERDGMTSSEWYAYLIGRFITGLNEADDQINYVAQLKELKRLRKLAEIRRDFVDSSYDYWRYIEIHPKFFRYYFYVINPIKKKYRGFLIKDNIDSSLENRLDEIKKFFKSQQEIQVVIDSLDRDSFLKKRNFFYRFMSKILTKSELDFFKENKNLSEISEFQSSKILWILKKIAIDKDLKKLVQNENNLNSNDEDDDFYNNIKYILYQDKDLLNSSNILINRMLKGDVKNDDKNFKKSKSLLKNKIYQEIIYYWTNKFNRTYYEILSFEINFMYCFLKNQVGLKNFYFKDIEWSWYISLIIYLLIGWM